jgi:hypothetical protein
MVKVVVLVVTRGVGRYLTQILVKIIMMKDVNDGTTRERRFRNGLNNK